MTMKDGTKGSADLKALVASDPDFVRVLVRTALQGAASVAGLLVTTEAMVAEKPKQDTAQAMPGGGMDY